MPAARALKPPNNPWPYEAVPIRRAFSDDRVQSAQALMNGRARIAGLATGQNRASQPSQLSVAGDGFELTVPLRKNALPRQTARDLWEAGPGQLPDGHAVINMAEEISGAVIVEVRKPV